MKKNCTFFDQMTTLPPLLLNHRFNNYNKWLDISIFKKSGVEFSIFISILGMLHKIRIQKVRNIYVYTLKDSHTGEYIGKIPKEFFDELTKSFTLRKVRPVATILSAIYLRTLRNSSNDCLDKNLYGEIINSLSSPPLERKFALFIKIGLSMRYSLSGAFVMIFSIFSFLLSGCSQNDSIKPILDNDYQTDIEQIDDNTIDDVIDETPDEDDIEPDDGKVDEDSKPTCETIYDNNSCFEDETGCDLETALNAVDDKDHRNEIYNSCLTTCDEHSETITEGEVKDGCDDIQTYDSERPQIKLVEVLGSNSNHKSSVAIYTTDNTKIELEGYKLLFIGINDIGLTRSVYMSATIETGEGIKKLSITSSDNQDVSTASEITEAPMEINDYSSRITFNKGEEELILKLPDSLFEKLTGTTGNDYSYTPEGEYSGLTNNSEAILDLIDTLTIKEKELLETYSGGSDNPAFWEKLSEFMNGSIDNATTYIVEN